MVKTKLKPTALYFGHDGTESGLYELRLNYGAPTRSVQSPLRSPVPQSAATRGADLRPRASTDRWPTGPDVASAPCVAH